MTNKKEIERLLAEFRRAEARADATRDAVRVATRVAARADATIAAAIAAVRAEKAEKALLDYIKDNT